MVQFMTILQLGRANFKVEISKKTKNLNLD